MVNINELVSDLRENLIGCDFSNHESIVVGQGHQTDIISTNGTIAPKLICAVVSIPSDVTTAKQGRAFIQTLRRGLTRHFRGFPRPKRLGTCVVLLGGRKQCKALEPHKAKLIDQKGMRVNVIVSAVLIDTETFTSRSDITWGLMDVARPFSLIQSAVDNWCAQYRKPKRMATAGHGQALKIA